MKRQMGDGSGLKLAGHVYRLDDNYAELLNEVNGGDVCEPWTPEMAEANPDVKPEPEKNPRDPKTALVDVSAWKRSGSARGRLTSGA
jgi:hypothetical protein